jgi:hypothetical protein
MVVITKLKVCKVWNKWFVNLFYVRLPHFYSDVIYYIHCCNTACLCNVILLERSWMIWVSRGHPTDFLSSMVHMYSRQRSLRQ